MSRYRSGACVECGSTPCECEQEVHRPLGRLPTPSQGESSVANTPLKYDAVVSDESRVAASVRPLPPRPPSKSVSVPVCADCVRPEERDGRHHEWDAPLSPQVVHKACTRCGHMTGCRVWALEVADVLSEQLVCLLDRDSMDRRTRRIYLASSWRNEHQPRIVALLRDAGHEVYDFRNPQAAFVGAPLGPQIASGFSWSEVDPNWSTWTPSEYVAGLKHPRAQEGFYSDFNAMQWCDTCVVLMPCGPSAALEAGWCKGSRRRLVVHVAGMREPDLMYLVADAFTLDDQSLLREVSRG